VGILARIERETRSEAVAPTVSKGVFIRASGRMKIAQAFKPGLRVFKKEKRWL